MVALLVGAGTASAVLPRQPVLELVGDESPVLVGTKFKPSERVVLVITAGSKVMKRGVWSNAHGGFRVALPNLGSGPCTTYAIAARGPGGERAFTGLSTTGCASPGVTIPGAGS